VAVADEAVGFGIEAVQAPGGSRPDASRLVLGQAPDPFVGQAGGIVRFVAESPEFPGVPVHPEESLQRCDPQRSPPILQQILDAAESRGFRSVGIRRIVDEGSGFPIQPAQSSGRSDPEIAVPVFPQDVHPVVAKTSRVRRIVSMDLEFHSVVPIQSSRGPEPEKAGAVLENGFDITGGKAGVRGQVPEDRVLFRSRRRRRGESPADQKKKCEKRARHGLPRKKAGLTGRVARKENGMFRQGPSPVFGERSGGNVVFPETARNRIDRERFPKRASGPTSIRMSGEAGGDSLSGNPQESSEKGIGRGRGKTRRNGIGIRVRVRAIRTRRGVLGDGPGRIGKPVRNES
jgi:hypothetical protein